MTETTREKNSETPKENVETAKEKSVETAQENNSETPKEKSVETTKEKSTQTVKEKNAETTKEKNTETVMETTEMVKENNNNKKEQEKEKKREKEKSPKLPPIPTHNALKTEEGNISTKNEVHGPSLKRDGLPLDGNRTSNPAEVPRYKRTRVDIEDKVCLKEQEKERKRKEGNGMEWIMDNG
jgi:hypothetical protein